MLVMELKAGDVLSVLVGDRPRADGLIKVCCNLFLSLKLLIFFVQAMRDTGEMGYVSVDVLEAIDPFADIGFGFSSIFM